MRSPGQQSAPPLRCPRGLTTFHLALRSRPPGLASVLMTRSWELFCGLPWVAGCQHTPRFSGGPWRGAVRGAQHREICYRRGGSWVEGLAALCPSGADIVTGTRCEVCPGAAPCNRLPAWAGGAGPPPSLRTAGPGLRPE